MMPIDAMTNLGFEDLMRVIETEIFILTHPRPIFSWQ